MVPNTPSLRSEIKARIALINSQIDEQKKRAKDSMGDAPAIQEAARVLRELHVRLTELQSNLKQLDER